MTPLLYRSIVMVKKDNILGKESAAAKLPVNIMVKTEVISGINEYKLDKAKGIVSFAMIMKNMPNAIVKKAKAIDGENYAPDCFGFRYTYNTRTKTYTLEKNNGRSVYYLDNDGEMHYMDYEVPKNITSSATSKCNKVLQKIGIKKKRKSPSCKEAPKNEEEKTKPAIAKKTKATTTARNAESSNPVLQKIILYPTRCEGKSWAHKYVSGQYTIFSEYVS